MQPHSAVLTDVTADAWINEEPYFLLRKNNVRYVIRVEEMMYVESYERFLYVHMFDSSVIEVAQKPIEYIIEQARSKELFRCGRGILVNRRYIDEVDITNKRILMSDGTCLKIGVSYVESMKILKKCLE